MPRYLVCMTGASGAAYGLRVLSALASPAGPCPGAELHFVASAWAERVALEETGRSLADQVAALGPGCVRRHAIEDMASPLASGSFRLDATVIAPCSMGTIGSIAAGLSANLIQRAAAVALKEGRPLVLVPRESPLSLPSLRALVALKEAGAAILPASPGFYSRPERIEDLIDQIAARILDSLGLEMPGAKRWAEGGEE